MAETRAQPTDSVARITARDLENFRQRLQEKRDQVMAHYQHGVREGLKASRDGMEDMVDLATIASSRDLNFALSDGERDLLEQVEGALERVSDGTFATCSLCQKVIGSLRLQAVPWARYCIDCQEMAEQGMLQEA